MEAPWPEAVTLVGEHASLVPLAPEHAADLREATADGELWTLWYTRVPTPEGMDAEIARRLGERERGAMLPFAVLDPNGKAVGMTTYMNIDPRTPRVEIGSTWYRAQVQRTAINTECKRMLLAQAFEALGCTAVEFRTHWMNHQSRRAIERLGARLDGVLRAHQRMADGSLRDTCVYSITATDWPAVRAHLDHKLGKPIIPRSDCDIL